MLVSREFMTFRKSGQTNLATLLLKLHVSAQSDITQRCKCLDELAREMENCLGARNRNETELWHTGCWGRNHLSWLCFLGSLREQPSYPGKKFTWGKELDSAGIIQLWHGLPNSGRWCHHVAVEQVLIHLGAREEEAPIKHGHFNKANVGKGHLHICQVLQCFNARINPPEHKCSTRENMQE